MEGIVFNYKTPYFTSKMMRKSILFLFTALIITSSYGQSYKEPLEKLNKYLETFDGGSYGHIEIINGYFCSGDFRIKEKMVDINSANTGEGWLDNAAIVKYNNNKKNFYFKSESKFYLPHLIILLNDFICSYNSINDTGNSVIQTKFTGTLKDGKKYGKGKYFLINGTYIDGNFENDMLVGKGEIYYENGDVYTGDIKDNKPSGEGIITYKSHGDYKTSGTYKGTFKNGLPNGKGVSKIVSKDVDESNKNSTYEGTWKDGLEDGEGIYKQINTENWHNYKWKSSYKGNWKNGLKDGYGVLSESRFEEKYDGNWKNNLRDGQGISTKRNKNEFDGEWSKDKQVKGKFYDLAGKFYFEGTEEAMLRKRKNEAYVSDDQQVKKSEKADDCVCSKCNGSGTFTVKTIELYYPEIIKDGKVVGRSNYSKTIDKYEKMTCGRCLGTGKCK